MKYELFIIKSTQGNYFSKLGYKSSLSAGTIMVDTKVTQIEAKNHPGFLASYRLLISFTASKKIQTNNINALSKRKTFFPLTEKSNFFLYILTTSVISAYATISRNQ